MQKQQQTHIGSGNQKEFDFFAGRTLQRSFAILQGTPSENKQNNINAEMMMRRSHNNETMLIRPCHESWCPLPNRGQVVSQA
jgi:hypothetical protein